MRTLSGRTGHKPSDLHAGEEEEEEAFPQTPSSLKNAMWGSKLWSEQSPVSQPPAGASPTPQSTQPYSAAHPVSDPDSATAAGYQGPPLPWTKNTASPAAAKTQSKTTQKAGRGAVNIAASCVAAEPAAATGQAKAADQEEAEEEVDRKAGSHRVSAWALLLCLVVAAQVGAAAWAVTAVLRSQPRPAAGVGGTASPPRWWGLPPQWQFKGPPFWGWGPPPRWGFWAPSMADADLESLVGGSTGTALKASLAGGDETALVRKNYIAQL